jgi:hypothetical protein
MLQLMMGTPTLLQHPATESWRETMKAARQCSSAVRAAVGLLLLFDHFACLFAPFFKSHTSCYLKIMIK